MNKQEGLAKCKFCRRIFNNKQAVKAHLKGCIAYRERIPRQRVHKAMPEARNTLLPEGFRERSGVEGRKSRNEIISEVINESVEEYSKLRNDIPIEAKARAIMEIRRELSPLPVNSISFSDLLEMAERIKDRIYKPVIQAQNAANTQKAADEKTNFWQKEDESHGALERMREITRKERRREALVESAIRNAEQQLNRAPGIEIWNQWPAMEKVKGALAREVIGTESPEEIEELVDELLLPFLEEGAHRVAEERKGKLIDFGKTYTEEELDEEEDLNSFERAMICEKVRQALVERLTGNESKTQVEEIVDDFIDDELM